MDQLTDRDAEILAFTRLWFRHEGMRESVVRERWDMTMVRFWQEVNRIIDLPAAEAHDPHEVRRLRNIRSARLRSRFAQSA